MFVLQGCVESSSDTCAVSALALLVVTQLWTGPHTPSVSRGDSIYVTRSLTDSQRNMTVSDVLSSGLLYV